MIAAHLLEEIGVILPGPGYHAPQAVGEDASLPVTLTAKAPKPPRNRSRGVGASHLTPIADIVRGAGRPVTVTEVTLTYEHLGASSVGDALALLEQRGIIRSLSKKARKGKPRLWVAK